MTLRISRHALALAVLLAPLPTLAQWSKTPDSNLVIGDGPSEQIQGKLAPLADGGFYVSWFDNAGGGYDVRLQRLDVKGRPVWGHNGRMLADRGLDWTTDYGLDVDAQGNAVLAFHDKSAVDGLNHVLVSKVAADGRALWGNDSGLIRLPSGPHGGMSPHVAVTSDGGTVVAWSGNTGTGGSKVVLQRLDANGAMEWGEENIELVAPSGSFLLADLKATSDGGVVVSWSAQLSRFNNQYWMQKFDRNGNPVWGDAPLRVWDATANGNGMLQFGYFPEMVSDGQGGVATCWNLALSAFRTRVRVQHIDADGVERFGHGGMTVSTDEFNNRYDCSATYDQAADDIYVLWRELTPGTNNVQTGIYAQRIDGNGQRQWGDGGNILMPLDPILKSQLSMVPIPGGFVAAWALQSYPQAMPVHAMRVDKDGSYGWSRGIVSLKTSSSDMGRLFGTASSDGYAAFAWTDFAAAGQGDLVVQNIGRDGVLGKKEQGSIK